MTGVDVRALLHPDAGIALGESRARVLDVLRAAGDAVGVQEVARQTGLHPNTVRFHLDGLVEAGFVTRQPQRRETPGRPSMTYQVAEDAGPAGQRRYRLLAEMLTTLIAGAMPRPQDAAAEAGREWGRFLTEPPPPYQRLDAEHGVDRLAATMRDLGFAPEVAANGDGYRLRLHQCPFREVAERHQDVVCALHLGLIQGVLAQLRAPVTTDGLQPFAEPTVCVAELTAGTGKLAGAPKRVRAARRRSRSDDGDSSPASL